MVDELEVEDMTRRKSRRLQWTDAVKSHEAVGRNREDEAVAAFGSSFFYIITMQGQ
jgi:hypothetical protein